MIVRCNACSADPCARWKPPPARIFILSELTGAFETSPVRLPRSLVAEAGGRDSKSGKKTTGGRRANCDERPTSAAHATEDAAALDDCQEAADYAPLRRLCSAARQTLLDTLPNPGDHHFEDGCRTMDVGSWLRSLGLGQYEATFRDNEIDGAVLPKLTVDDLKDLGVAIVGHRRKMISAIEALNTPFAAPVAADAAERRHLTVMFCDLVGSTALSARLDPEDMGQVIHTYQDACSGVLARYDGFVAKFFGDGILATFGFPRAHEDDAARAVHAALDITDAVGRLQTRAGEKLAVRIGIATGLVVAGDIVGQGAAQEQVVVGDTPNLAARLQSLADAGGVVVSAATRRLIGDRFRLKDMGRHTIKGLAQPVEAYAALGVSQSESRFDAAHSARLTGFVGREAESAELIALQRRAWGGKGQTVLISGEAGIGKSRLSAWLTEQVADTAHIRLRYQCSPYHRDSALHPFAQQFERAAGIASQEPPEAKLDKLEKVLGFATERMNEVVPLVASMLSIPLGTRYPALTVSPAQQRRLTLSALLDRMRAWPRGSRCSFCSRTRIGPTPPRLKCSTS